MKDLIVAITGASGVIYARRLLEFLVQKDVTVHLIVSKNSEAVLEDELFIKPEALYRIDEEKIIPYDPSDFASAPASGTAPMDAMVVVPCSMSSLATIAHGLTFNLIHRAAAVTLKEGRPLLIVPRETPIGVINIENMLKLSKLGAAIIPAMPAFYHHPKSVNEIVDFIVTRILDRLGIESDLIQRWSGRTDD